MLLYSGIKYRGGRRDFSFFDNKECDLYVLSFKNDIELRDERPRIIEVYISFT